MSTGDNSNKEEQLDMFYNFYGDILPKGTQEELKQSSCYHEWKEYIGLTESYKYCSRCDLKKGIE